MMDSPKKLHEQLSSDPDKTPVSNPTNTTDSETEELTPQGKGEHGWSDLKACYLTINPIMDFLNTNNSAVRDVV
jgi:hypothetical protein